MKTGYIRVYVGNDTRVYQEELLKPYNCDKIIIEHASANADSQRPLFNALLRDLKTGDTLVIAGLNIAILSINHLLEFINRLEIKSINLVAIEDGIDTATSYGKAFIEHCAIIKGLEQKLQSERSSLVHNFRRDSKRLGRSAGITTKAQQKAQRAVDLYKDASKTVNEICDELDITRATFYRYLRHMGIIVAGRS